MKKDTKTVIITLYQPADAGICVLGSSVAKGEASDDVAIAEYLGARLGCEFTKIAVSGTTLTGADPESYITRLKELRVRYGIGIVDLWTDKEFNNISDGDRAVYTQKSYQGRYQERADA